MTIRSKLVSLYGLLLITLLAAAAAYIHTQSLWRLAAEELSGIHDQDLRAEQLRAGIQSQVNRGLDFLGGHPDALADLERLKTPMEGWLAELEAHARTRIEGEHIEGLAETYAELEWRLAGLQKSRAALGAAMDVSGARARLREIAEEVSDDVAALNQYYQSQVNERMDAAAEAGGAARIVTAVAAGLVILQIVWLVVLIQRWLMRPMAAVSRTAGRIAEGDLTARVAMSGHDEWRALGQAINEMAASLEVARQRERTQERFSTLGEVAAYAAHNIKNPLASIRMTAQSSLAQFRAKGEEISEPLVDIIQAADRLDSWIRRFLDFARPLDLCIEDTDLNALVEQAASLVGAKEEYGAVTLERALATAPGAIRIDPILIEQAVVLLLGNAFESGGDRVRVETSYYRDPGGRQWAAVTIDDNGVGLPEGMADDLFKVFVTRKKDGTGLGLSQTRKIVDLHGGSVGFETKPEPGARIVMRIPYTESTEGEPWHK